MRYAAAILAALGSLTLGCADRARVGTECPANGCAGLATDGAVAEGPRAPIAPPVVGAYDTVDLLVVVDGDSGLAEPGQTLGDALRGLVDKLFTGELEGPGGRPEFHGASLVNAAVISADLGSARQASTGPCAGGGLDGSPAYEPVRSACPAELPTRFLLEQGGMDGQFDDLVCRLEPPAGACGLSQPLDAVLAALGGDVPSTVPPPLRTGPPALEGFLTEGSLLVVLAVALRDDCSVVHRGFYDITFPVTDAEAQRAHCRSRPLQLRDTRSFRASLRNLHPTGEVVFATLASVPPDLVTAQVRAANPIKNGNGLYDAILGDPRMQGTPRLGPCQVEGSGGSPSRRLVASAREFGMGGVVASLCGDLDTELSAVARTVGHYLGVPGLQ